MIENSSQSFYLRSEARSDSKDTHFKALEKYFDSLLWKVEKLTNSLGETENIINKHGYPALWDIKDFILIPGVSVFYAPISNIHKKKDLSLFDIYYLIKSDRLLKETNELRSISDTKRNRKYKANKFPYATFSGKFNSRNDNDIISHSGLIAIDIDHLGERLQEVRTIINNLPQTVLSFISPNGDGLKAVFRIDITLHSQEVYYKAISKELEKLCSLPENKIDASCKNVSRACFLCHDANVFINPKLYYHE